MTRFNIAVSAGAFDRLTLTHGDGPCGEAVNMEP